MKIFLVIIALIIFQSTSKIQDNDLSIELLKGKVKSCTVTLYIGDNDGSKKDVFVNKIKTEYNQKGYKTRITSIKAPENIKKVYDYKYDDKGELIGDHMQGSKTIEKEKGGGKTETRISETGLISLRKYNAQNYLLERITKDQNEKLLSKSIITNDNNGNIIKEESYNSLGKLTQTTIRQYDKHNNNVEMIIFDNSGGKWTITHKYGLDNGPLIEKRSITETKRGYSQQMTITKYSDSDKNNNWLKSVETKEFGEVTIKVREIEYY